MIDQRKNASANDGTEPASPRARIMLEACAVATRMKPTSAIVPAQPALSAIVAGL